MCAMFQVQQYTTPFNNVFTFLAGDYQQDVHDSLMQLLKAGGATILCSEPEVSSKLDDLSNRASSTSRVVILCADSCASFSKQLKANIKAALKREGPKIAAVISYKWIAESITCAKAMPALLFEPTTQKDLWRLSTK
jgi:hypothetical protein